MALGSRFLSPRIVAGDQNNIALPGAIWAFYATGGTTPQSAYSDQGLTLPILTSTAGSDGRFPAIFLDPSLVYHVRLTDSTGAIQYDEDPYTPVGSGLSLSSLGNVSQGLIGQPASGSAAIQTVTAAQAATLVAAMTGDSGAGGVAGLAPAPAAGDAAANRFLRASGTWVAAGYPGIPLAGGAVKTVAYTAVIGDLASDIFFGANVNGTIPANASVAFNFGDFLMFSWDATFSGQVLIAGGDTLRWLTGNATGSRTVTGPGWLTCVYKKTREWWCWGQNVT